MAQGSDPHARHDALLVAGLAAGDLAEGELSAATALVRDCPECKRLHDDVVSLARATAALPAAARTRDFTISLEQAQRLRPAGWRGLVAAFTGPRLAFTRSLGVGLTTLGLAGLLLTALPSVSIFQSSGAASAPSTMESLGAESYVGGGDAQGEGGSQAPVDAGAGEPAASMAAAPGASPVTAAAPSVAASGDTIAQAPATGRDTGRSNVDNPNEAVLQVEDETARRDPNYVLIGSVALVLFGLALLVMRRVAGRIAAP